MTEIAALGSVRAVTGRLRQQRRRRRRLQALVGASLGDFPAPPCAADAAGSACADPCSPLPGHMYRITILPQAAATTGGKVKIVGVVSC